MVQRISNPVVLVSGSRGLARAFLDAFANLGARLVVLARTEAAKKTLLSTYPKTQIQVEVGDLADSKTRERWVQAAVDRWQRIDLLINNAAELGPGGKLGDIAIEDFARTLSVNLLAPAHTIQLALPHLSPNAAVISLSGGGATQARPFFSAYGAAKCGLVRLTETLAVEYPHFRFFAISPGAMKTGMMESIAQFGAERIGGEFQSAQKVLESGGANPEKVAALAVWLFESAEPVMSGRLVSAVWDKVEGATDAIERNRSWWTLRRVDEKCREEMGMSS